MPIPDFQTLMLPILRIAADGREHSLADVIDALADEFGLTVAERGERLPSGRQTRLANRVGWAKTYLKKTHIVEDTARGRFRITDRGRTVLRDPPEKITLQYLDRFPELAEFRRSAQPEPDDDRRVPSATPSHGDGDTTPEEALEASYLGLRHKLAEELLERIKACPPSFFEQLVIDLLVAMGYGGSRQDAGKAVGQTGDGGIDGIIKEDRLGLDAIYLQAKRWDSTVGRPVVQAFAGSLEGHRARKGVLITTGTFSREAKEYVSLIEKKIVLIDGDELAQLMITHGVGVTEVASYVVKRVDLDYFGGES